jgi:enediyne polyketide synthase
LSAADVLLVTGGGKGIAAECALDLARTSGARLAIVGRSRPDADSALAENLARLEAAGVRFGYFVADVADAEQVRAAVRAIESSLGAVTAVLHGAGANEPRPIASSMPRRSAHAGAQAARARNVIESSAASRSVVAFGSIIARLGLPVRRTRRGERMDGTPPRWRARARGAGAWRWNGRWSGRDGRNSAASSGSRTRVTAITPDLGVRAARVVEPADTPGPCRERPLRRAGDAPAGPRELPMSAFLERVRVDVPGVERSPTPSSRPIDPYLEGPRATARLFPAVMGLGR